jgi:hypothetical protein
MLDLERHGNKRPKAILWYSLGINLEEMRKITINLSQNGNKTARIWIGNLLTTLNEAAYWRTSFIVCCYDDQVNE